MDGTTTVLPVVNPFATTVVGGVFLASAGGGLQEDVSRVASTTEEYVPEVSRR